jgi:hypothetical protein
MFVVFFYVYRVFFLLQFDVVHNLFFVSKLLVMADANILLSCSYNIRLLLGLCLCLDVLLGFLSPIPTQPRSYYLSSYLFFIYFFPRVMASEDGSYLYLRISHTLVNK